MENCSASTATISIFVLCRNRSSARPAGSPRRDSKTIAVSKAFAAESKRVSDSLSSSRNFPRSGAPSRIASSAEVSMTTGTAILGQTRRNTVLIVAQDFILGPFVESRQGVHALQDVLDLLGKPPRIPPSPHALQPVLQRPLYDLCNGLPSLLGKFPG